MVFIWIFYSNIKPVQINLGDDTQEKKHVHIFYFLHELRTSIENIKTLCKTMYCHSLGIYYQCIVYNIYIYTIYKYKNKYMKKITSTVNFSNLTIIFYSKTIGDISTATIICSILFRYGKLYNIQKIRNKINYVVSLQKHRPYMLSLNFGYIAQHIFYYCCLYLSLKYNI